MRFVLILKLGCFRQYILKLLLCLIFSSIAGNVALTSFLKKVVEFLVLLFVFEDDADEFFNYLVGEIDEGELSGVELFGVVGV